MAQYQSVSMEQIAILSLRPYRRYVLSQFRMTSNYNHRLILIASLGSRLQRRKLWPLVLIRLQRPLYHSRLFRRPRCQHRCQLQPLFLLHSLIRVSLQTFLAYRRPLLLPNRHFNLHY